MTNSPDDLTALVATLSAVTNLNRVGLGAFKILTMLRSQFGKNVFSKSAEQKSAERLLAASTSVEEQQRLTAGEYDLKEYKLLREERLRRIKKALKDGNVSLEKRDLSDIESLFEQPGSDLASAAEEKGPFEYVEQKRARNIKNATREAVNDLPNHPRISEVVVDDDWAARFFDHVKDISHEDMQRLWGKVLAGEVARPGSYSLRTLDVLRNLSREEAKLFERYCGYTTSEGDLLLSYEDEPFRVRGINISREDVMRLDECGLVKSGGGLILGGSDGIVDGQIKWRDIKYEIHFGKMSLVFDFPKSDRSMGMPSFSLTTAGSELRGMINAPTDEAYVAALVAHYEQGGLRPKVVRSDARS